MPRKTSRAPDGYYTILQAERITGINGRTLRDWIAKNVIIPAKGESRRGSSIWLSYRNLLEIKIIARLRQVTSLQRVRKALEELHRMGFDSPTDCYWLDASADDIHIYLTEDKAMSAVKKSGQMLLMDVMKMKQELKEEVIRAIEEAA